MKKFITLVLALVMVLAIAAPAMAFTTTTYEDSTDGYDLTAVVVDYVNDAYGFFTNSVLNAPASTRGYVTNEVVCVVASLYIPKGKNPGDFEKIEATAKNVSLNLLENKGTITSNAGLTATYSDDTVTVPLGTDDNATALKGKAANRNFTANMAFFGKVTGSNASVTVSMNKNSSWTNETSTATVNNVVVEFASVITVGDYTIKSTQESSSKLARTYYFFNKAGNKLLFAVDVNAKNIATGAKFYLAGGEAADSEHVGKLTLPGKKLVFLLGGTELDPDVTDAVNYKALKKIYDDDFVGGWGFDLTIDDGEIRPAYFTTSLKADDLSVTVEIKPWVAEIFVPEEDIIGIPPKTGDALNFVGFMMIALCGLAVVAVKKVRA